MQNNSAFSLSDNTEKSISIFENPEFGTIRTAEINGKIHFCGKDVASSLGYKEPTKAIREHCKVVSKIDIGVVTGKKNRWFRFNTVCINFFYLRR